MPKDVDEINKYVDYLEHEYNKLWQKHGMTCAKVLNRESIIKYHEAENKQLRELLNELTGDNHD
jgi:hypothetical protein